MRAPDFVTVPALHVRPMDVVKYEGGLRTVACVNLMYRRAPGLRAGGWSERPGVIIRDARGAKLYELLYGDTVEVALPRSPWPK